MSARTPARRQVRIRSEVLANWLGLLVLLSLGIVWVR